MHQRSEFGLQTTDLGGLFCAQGVNLIPQVDQDVLCRAGDLLEYRDAGAQARIGCGGGRVRHPTPPHGRQNTRSSTIRTATTISPP